MVKSPPINKKRILTPIAIIIALSIFLTIIPHVTSTLLIKILENRVGIKIEYSEKIPRGVFNVSLSDLILSQDGLVLVKLGEVRVQYNLLNILLGHLRLNLNASGISYQFNSKTVSRYINESMRIEGVEADIKLITRKKAQLKYVRFTGPFGHIYASGDLEKYKKLDLNISCYFYKDFLNELPEFFQSNLFKENPTPLRKIQFSLNGDWYQPSINFQSDLVQISFKRYEK